MAVPTKTGALRNTTGGAFTEQTVGGVLLGATASGPITGSLSILDAARLNTELNGTEPREKSSGVYTAKKILSGGAFAYNAASAGTWVMARVSETLAGVANTDLLFMSTANLRKSIHEFAHDFGVKMVSAWTTRSFAWTGKLANGNSVASRVLWLNAAGTAVSKPDVLNATNMFDIADDDAANKAVDDAANPTRAIPGELVIRIDFVTAGLSGGNFLDYRPITGM